MVLGVVIVDTPVEKTPKSIDKFLTHRYAISHERVFADVSRFPHRQYY